MTLARSASEVLSEHVTLEIEGIDRLYLNLCVPILQRPKGRREGTVPNSPRTASSDAAPLAVIKGSKTQLNWPAALSIDPGRGDVYMANDSGDSVPVVKPLGAGVENLYLVTADSVVQRYPAKILC